MMRRRACSRYEETLKTSESTPPPLSMVLQCWPAPPKLAEPWPRTHERRWLDEPWDCYTLYAQSPDPAEKPIRGSLHGQERDNEPLRSSRRGGRAVCC